MNFNQLSLGEKKQKLAQLYNEVNQQIYGYGFNKLRVDISDEKIDFLVKHKRVNVLKVIEDIQPLLKMNVDKVIYDEFKQAFHTRLKEEFELEFDSILRDYDPASEWASTVIMLNKSKKPIKQH